MTDIAVRDVIHWHELRARHGGASEAAALYGEGQWMTEFKLYHEKAGTLAHDELTGDLSVTAGKFFEPAIAAWAGSKWDPWVINKVTRYIECDDCPEMGASLDFEEAGTGIPVEIKWSVWGDGWEYEGDTLTDAPLYYMIQVQHQLACTGAAYGWLVAFCKGDLRRMRIEASPAIIADLKTRWRAFWAAVREGREPKPDYERDASAIGALFREAEDREIDLTGDGTVELLCARMIEGKATAKMGEAIVEASKAELLTKIGSASRATVGQYRIVAPSVAGSPGKILTLDMVGQRIGVRKGYRKLDVRCAVDNNRPD